MAKNLTTGLQRGLRQSIAGGLGTGDLFSTASLDLQFARHKSLDSRVTHTRQSSATYVDGDGVIRTAVTNLLLRSEEFNQSPWINSGAAITPNAGIAPNGKATATRIQDVASDTLRIVAGTTGQRKSIYARATSGSGTVAILGHAAVAKYIVTLTETWQRFDFSIDTTETGGTSIYAVDFRAGTLKDVLIWGAQLEESSTVGQYVKTTTAENGAPRFDHDPETGESLGLLVEESRQNLLTDSEDLTGYNKLNVTTPFDSSVINPTGSTGSYKILADSGLSTNSIRINKGASSANNIAVSAFVKKSTYRYVLIGFGGLSNSFTALFDIEPGLTSNRLLGQGGKGTYTNIDAGYQNFPNDWIRIWAVGTTSGTDGFTASLSPDATTFNITNWTAAGTEEIYAWACSMKITYPSPPATSPPKVLPSPALLT